MITAWLKLSKGSSIVEDSVVKISRILWFLMKNRGAKRHSSGFDQMEENLRRDHGAGSSGGGPTGRVVMRRYNVHDDDDGGGGDGDLMVECTGKYCKSCIAGLIADCVAICCCPCALFNFFTLAFVKFPWMVGRKCLGRGKKKRKKKKLALQESNINCKKCGGDINNSNVVVVERGGNLMKKGRVELGIENLYEEGEEEREREEMSGDDDSSRNSNFSARLEAERVWLELYQIGHLGFGRVSFTGIQ